MHTVIGVWSQEAARKHLLEVQVAWDSGFACGQMVLRERFKRGIEDLKDELELGLLDWTAMFVVSLERGLREERSKALVRAGLDSSLERLSLMVWDLLNR